MPGDTSISIRLDSGLLSLTPVSPPPKNADVLSRLRQARAHRAAGYVGRSAESVLKDMERIVAEAE
jgi:hypothetical protein